MGEEDKKEPKPVAPPTKVTPKDAVMAAFKYLSEVATPSQKINDVRIEELELIEEKTIWNVVLSYEVLGDFPFQKFREYKEFRIDANTGLVLAMKVKKI